MTRDEIMQLSGEALWEAVYTVLIQEGFDDHRKAWVRELRNDHRRWSLLGAIFRHVRGWEPSQGEAFNCELSRVLIIRENADWWQVLEPADAARALLLVKGTP